MTKNKHAGKINIECKVKSEHRMGSNSKNFQIIEKRGESTECWNLVWFGIDIDVVGVSCIVSHCFELIFVECSTTFCRTRAFIENAIDDRFEMELAHKRTSNVANFYAISFRLPGSN